MPRIQHKRGTSANLASVNPTPLAGELVWDSTENAIKIGDGATAWTSLAYVTATPRSHVHDGGDITTGTVAYARLPVGSTASTVCAGDDARLSDARTPTAHKSSHATGGSDALTPVDIGAAPAASPVITGNATFEASSGVPVTITNTGTGNSFVVNDASGDTTPFVVDASGRVGIGATSALGPLHVATVSNTDVYLQCADTAQSRINFGGVTDPDAGRIAYSDNVDAFLIFTDNAERIRITSTGSVGIGRTSPATALDVNGVITVAAGTAAAPAIVASGDSNTGAFFPAADTFAISTAGVERLRVDSSGNVGIGTSPSPFNALFNNLVVGNGSSTEGMTIYSSTQGTLAFGDTATTAVDGYRGSLSYIHSGDYMAIGTGGAERFRASAGGIKVTGVITADATSGSAGSYLPSLTISGDSNTGFGQVSGQSDTASVFTAGHERLRVDSSGRVGIGRTPSIDGTSLECANDIFLAATKSLFLYHANKGGGIGTPSNINFQIWARSDITDSIQFQGRHGTTGAFTDYLRIVTGGTGAGNVGVGTTSPTALLDINSDTMRLRTARTPASATAAGNAGDICWDASYLYICTATNTWRRIAHSTW